MPFAAAQGSLWTRPAGRVCWPFEIDWSHPGAVDLEECIVAAPMGMFNLVSRRSGFRSGSEDPGWQSAEGYAAWFDGDGDAYSFSNNTPVDAALPFAIVWESKIEGITDSSGTIALFLSAAGGGIRLLIRSPGRFYLCDSGSVPGGFDPPSGTLYTDHICGVWSYDPAIGHQAWINGEPCIAVAPITLSTRSNQMRIGASNVTNEDLFGGLTQVRLYRRAWTREEAIDFWCPNTRDALFRASGLGPAGAFGIRLYGDASAQTTGTAQLTTQIKITGAAASAAVANGSLTTQVRLSGAAASVAVANGVLTTQIRLSGAALAQVLASGALAASNAQLAGAASASAAGAGTLTTQIRLSGAAVMQALASAGLTTTPAGLSGSATATASASGALSTGIKLVGAASALAIAAGGLTTGIRLSGAAAAVSNASGDLTISGGFSASALAQVAATGTLTTQIRLNAQAVMQALASASLSLGGTPTRLVSRHYLSLRRRRVYRVTAE